MNVKRLGVIVMLLLISALAGCMAQARHDGGPAWPDQSYPTD